MKKLIKKMIPSLVLNKYYYWKKKQRFASLIKYDLERLAIYSGPSSSKDSLITSMLGNCHPLEKGFCMPNFRLGFGKNRLPLILDNCEEFIERNE